MTRQRMFADIALYKDGAFFESHRTGSLTLADGTHEVQFFAYLNVPATAPLYQAVFVTPEERRDYLAYILDTAVYCTPDAGDLTADDHLLLLSTCTFEYNEARGVLAGVIR